ncbi:hypothetical protein [Candidatus Chrysopegis kryptomonas]|uniref:Uncharacterized protein n=1 Tax=Candidatus Chryseopegocella kryptomonas TaxID=1633643 RepID=A0A0P1MNE8_9BACT|nr:hypothetical protein [Candidatus Chrysopegis kryptomonas]CUS97140.1 hypothetical protein JGI23_00248 [Candidatus Chrysopegis kryptomonas]
MFFKKSQHLRFEYIPRYYDPSKDEELKRRERIRHRLKIERVGISERKKRSLILWLIAIAIVFYLYLVLAGVL